MIFSAFFVFNSLAETRLFVGVSPSIVDLGEVERGTTNLVKFFVVTTSEEPFLVHLQPENGRLEFFNFSYKDFIFNYSEENTDKWVKFLSNPVELKPQNETIKTSYETIKGWREVNFLLEIPKDAEPGYHLIKINPNPSETPTAGGRVGARIVAMTPVNVIYKVPGEAIREGIVLDTVSGDYRNDELGIDTYFQNTGTTTVIARATQKVYDKDGNFITEIYSSKEIVKPKEVKTLKSFLPLADLSFGDYNILTSVSYTTGSAYKNSTIPITATILMARPKLQPEEFPTWIFIVFIIILAIIIYRWVH
jgi:hypothetical protein